MIFSNKNFHRVLRLLPNFLWPIKVLAIKKSIKRHGKNFKLGPNVIIYNRKDVEIGDDVFIGDKTTIGGKVAIKIGNNVMFGPEVMIRGGDHNFSVVGKPMRFIKEGGINLPINIEDDVWIGARVIILKGVRIMEGAVIGAGAIVTKDVLPYSINVGNPSKPIKSRFTISELEIHLKQINSKYTLENIVSLYNSKNKSSLIV